MCITKTGGIAMNGKTKKKNEVSIVNKFKENEIVDVKELLENADVACPYKGAKEHYVLDMDDADFCRRVVSEIEKVTPLPKKKK